MANTIPHDDTADGILDAVLKASARVCTTRGAAESLALAREMYAEETGSDKATAKRAIVRAMVRRALKDSRPEAAHARALAVAVST